VLNEKIEAAKQKKLEEERAKEEAKNTSKN